MTEVWRKRSTSRSIGVDVELSDFDTDQLLQALIDADMITADEALSIKNRNGTGITPPTIIKAMPDEIDIAWVEIQRGRRREALIHIERGLGRHWLGRLS